MAIAVLIGLRVFNESDKKSTVDVFDCVKKMRADRNGIVSSKDLYQYIFKVSHSLYTRSYFLHLMYSSFVTYSLYA